MRIVQLLTLGIVINISVGCKSGDPCFQEFLDTHCVQKDVVYPGSNLITSTNISIEECHQACQNHLECDHASYAPGQKICKLKYQKMYSTTESGFYAIPKDCIPNCSMDTKGSHNSNLPGSYLADSLMDCHSLCLEHPECVGVTWERPWEVNTKAPNACNLKRKMAVGLIRTSIFQVTLPRYCLHSREQPNGWHLYQNKYYKFINQINSYESGMVSCGELGGRLVSIESQEEFLFLRSVAFTLNYHHPEKYNGSYRLGLFKSNWTSLKWTLSNGNIFKESQIDLWCPKQPSIASSIAYARLWSGAGFCGDDIFSSLSTQNIICEASVCKEDLPKMKNVRKQAQIPNSLIHQ
ncbi:uncharacterized protein LOC131878284 [Tigriopus californicus]|uniref:uncharacterized protein LOC131878284 n=1 Tax=Tigriopus californicus TaxID=6832 RepID=UPI0027D9E1FC|nr:uncharacterized protein LOC131878284 [Tigriopus californicus]